MEAKKLGDKAPVQIHFLGSIIKSNEKIRNLGNVLSELEKTDDFKNIIETVINGATRGGALITTALTSMAGVIGSILGNIDDNPLITILQSLTDINSNFDALGRHPYIDSNRYVDLETILIILDAAREKASNVWKVIIS